MTPDGRRILLAQGLRAAVYGFVSIFLGVTLEAGGWSSGRVGLLLTAIVAGTALLSLVVGRYGERLGRRRTYALLYLGLGGAGVVLGFTDHFWALLVVGLTGALSTEVVESGPFTSLEQAMLPTAVGANRRTRIFGVYNALATVAGSLGALAAGGPALLRRAGVGLPADQRLFFVLVPVALVGAAVAASLSDRVETGRDQAPSRAGLGRSRPTVMRLAGLFALDSFGGGFVVQTFLAYWFRVRFGVSPEVLGLVFFAVGFLQAGSFLAASRLAERFGLLPTMVFTHLPSNLLLAAIPFAPNLGVALALLLGRFALSQMDVPTRQAYVVALVDPAERTAAAAYTNSARYLTRPLAPALGGLAQQAGLGLPFVLAGALKAGYDLALWRWFRTVPLPAPAGGHHAAAAGPRRHHAVGHP